MDAKQLWQVFMETGAPEIYLLYHKAMRMERSHVPDSPGLGTADNRLQ